MLESNLKVVNNDVKTLVKDTQALLQAAATSTGETAGGFVKANPWSTIGVAASVGLLTGVLLGRKTWGNSHQDSGKSAGDPGAGIAHH